MSKDQLPPFRPHPLEWTPEKVSKFWNYLSENDAGEFFSERTGRALAAQVMRLRPRSMVDIGCGTGPLIAELSARDVQCIGVDSSPEALDAARRRAPMATFHEGSVAALPLPDGSVDTATLIEVVEHLDDATLRMALTEARRVLRPAGTLMITTPNREDLSGAMRQCPDCGAEFHIYQHVRAWTAESLVEVLRTAGFATASAQPVTFFEQGSPLERLVPLAYRLLKRRPPRLLALATV